LNAAKGDEQQRLQAEWSHEFYSVQEEIDELQSDYVLQQAERLDVSIPMRATGEFWEMMSHAGDRMILTTRGREEVRTKIRSELKHARDAWGFYLGMAATIGSVLVALLAIYLRK
jgi:hypothetical protein